MTTTYNHKILVVDDQPEILEDYLRILAPEREGREKELASLETRLFSDTDTGARTSSRIEDEYTVVTASQGEEAISLVKEAVRGKESFAVAFIDVRMPPGINGVEAASEIRKIDPDIEIVFVTAYSDIDPSEIASRVPPMDKLLYVKKPFYPEEIRQFSSALSAKWQTEALLREAHGELTIRNEQLKMELAERKRAEEAKIKLQTQLQHAQKLEAIGRLAGGIAHDFNNILAVILGNAQLISMDIDRLNPHFELLDEIEKQIKSGSNLTKQLIGFARGGKYEIAPVGLNEVVRESSTVFGRTKKEITIHRKLQKDLPAIEADIGQIEQVLMNLYVNAAHAMPDGGNLYLETRIVTHEDIQGKPFRIEPGDYALLSVNDTGVGMDKATQERIFDPFFTTREMGGGAGLGLASVYGIIQVHKGYIEVESEKGRGTTFKIFLPVSKKEAARPVKLAEDVIKGTETILLVDDEEPVLRIGAKTLNRLGYTVLEAASGHEAVEIYKANKIDLIILDMIMPDMGGGKVYDLLKAINPDIKVLLCSGYSIDGQATEILKRGCNGFIQKPFDVKDLSEKIREILEPITKGGARK